MYRFKKRKLHMKNLFSLFLLVLCMPINRCQAESTIQSRIDAGSTLLMFPIE